MCLYSYTFVRNTPQPSISHFQIQAQLVAHFLGSTHIFISLLHTKEFCHESCRPVLLTVRKAIIIILLYWVASHWKVFLHIHPQTRLKRNGQVKGVKFYSLDPTHCVTQRHKGHLVHLQDTVDLTPWVEHACLIFKVACTSMLGKCSVK